MICPAPSPDHSPLVLEAGTDFDSTIVIATIGKPEVCYPTLKALADNIPERTRIVVVINPRDSDDGLITADMAERLRLPERCRMDVLVYPGPVGFGGGHNAGLAFAARDGNGVGELIVFYNDDLRATPGWLQSLHAAVASDEISLATDGGPGRPRRVFSREAWGRAGLVGPVTTAAAGQQGCVKHGDPEQAGGHDAFADEWRARTPDHYVSTEFLSGFCVAATRECAQALLIPCPVAGWGVWDSERYPVAGFEDNDICVRALDAGYRMVIDMQNYVGHIGHQSFDAAFPEWDRGLRNRGHFYEKWEPVTQRDQRLVGVYRVRVGSVHDLHLWMQSLQRHASILDGVSVLLTNDPIPAMQAYPDWSSHTHLAPTEQALLTALAANQGNPAKVRELMWAWTVGVLKAGPRSRFTSHKQVRLEIWTGEFNERDERNFAITNGETLNPDWLISIDADELIEDRVRRQHFDRLMSNPDPMVSSYDFGWMDHWNDGKHYRTDGSWGDGGRYDGGRHGRRMWRFRPAFAGSPAIVLGTDNGLHCGNAPDTSMMSVRVTGIRFRHFGYVRPLDREERFRRYTQLDPNPDPLLVGGATYGHIIAEHGARMEVYQKENGIALHMLVHAGEKPGNVASILDAVYALVDHIVLVWTDDASPEPADDGTPGAMPEELAMYARLYKCDIIHAKLRDEHGLNFAAARNAGIEHIAAVNAQFGLGLSWGLFFDPDELMPYGLTAQVALRRMAQLVDGYGWIFPFQNPLPSGVVTMSESVRMHRLEPVMRMAGRVHESFDEAVRTIRQTGEPNIHIAPFTMLNPGLAGRDIAKKIRRYAEGLSTELSLNPMNGGAWVALGLQFEAEGRIGEAVRCYQLGCETLPESYVGYRSMLVHQLRVALAFALETEARLSPSHGYYPIVRSIIDFLQRAAPPADNPAGFPVLGDLTLPAPPVINARAGLADALRAAVAQAGEAVADAQGGASAPAGDVPPAAG